MKINFGQKANFNHSMIGMKKDTPSVTNKQLEKKDSISIGLQARQLFNGGQQKNSLIENLMKQRESIQEMKSDLTQRAIEKGEDLSGIKEKTKHLEEQIAEIDAQIVQMQKEKEEGSTSTTSKAKESEPITTEEAIISQAGSLEQAKTLGRMNRTLTREKATLDSQMKMDASRGVHSEFKANRLERVEQQISTVQKTLAEKVEEMSTTPTQESEANELLQDQLFNKQLDESTSHETNQDDTVVSGKTK